MLWLAFVVAFLCSLAIIPLVRKICLKWGYVAEPRPDRWHNKPTATLGGIGIFAAFITGILAFRLLTGAFGEILLFRIDRPLWGLLIGTILIFLLGLFDDVRQLSPPVKLVGQLLAAVIVVSFGISTAFFTPRVENETLAQLLNVLLTIIWIVGITNAINLLDNMDGLAGGISLIAAGLLSFLFFEAQSYGLLVISLALAGSVLGFLFYNFPPASIFMGDSGSQFLGFTLAVLAIARHPQASNVFAVLGVPTLLLLIPILDTSFVAFTRMLRGQSPMRGGSDHTSHRLIAFGLSERQAVLILYAIAIFLGVVAISIETIGYWLSLVFVPILVIALSLIIAYLAGMRVVADGESHTGGGLLARFVYSLTYKRRMLEILLDVAVIAVAYYLAYLIVYGIPLERNSFETYLQSLPVVIVITIAAFILFGVYKGVWRYVGFSDFLRYFGAVVVSFILIIIAIPLIFVDANYDIVLFVLFTLLLFIGLTATRSSFRILDMASIRLQYRQPISSREDGEINNGVSRSQRVLIVGAGAPGEIALRWMQADPQLKYTPVGYLVDDPYFVGRTIHGVRVLGVKEQIGEVIDKHRIDGVILTSGEGERGDSEALSKVCNNAGCWIRQMKLDFELLGNEH